MTPKESPGHVYESDCLNQITPPGQATYHQQSHGPFSLCVRALMCGGNKNPPHGLPNTAFLYTQLYAGAILEVCGWKLGRFPQVQGEFLYWDIFILWYLILKDSNALWWACALFASVSYSTGVCVKRIPLKSLFAVGGLKRQRTRPPISAKCHIRLIQCQVTLMEILQLSSVWG